MEERSWEGAAHEYEEQARFARAERDSALERIAELEAELARWKIACKAWEIQSLENKAK